jgi:transcription elongation factor Elf1
MKAVVTSKSPENETQGNGQPRVRTARTRRSPTFTSTPDPAPPELTCPRCDQSLNYMQTVISGVKPIERWDYFKCRTCGPFVYRDRTRRLRPIA